MQPDGWCFARQSCSTVGRASASVGTPAPGIDTNPASATSATRKQQLEENPRGKTLHGVISRRGVGSCTIRPAWRGIGVRTRRMRRARRSSISVGIGQTMREIARPFRSLAGLSAPAGRPESPSETPVPPPGIPPRYDSARPQPSELWRRGNTALTLRPGNERPTRYFRPRRVACRLLPKVGASAMGICASPGIRPLSASPLDHARSRGPA
jgi:hypothetical protein